MKILFFLILFSIPAFQPAGGLVSAQKTYYVSSSGNDANNGASPTTPWKTLNKISISTFIPGDNILLKRGDTLYGEISKPLWETGYIGTASNPLYIGAYGAGAKPIIMMDCSNFVWTKRAGYDSIWAAYNNCSIYSTIAFEYVDDYSIAMKNYAGDIRDDLEDVDSLDTYLKSLTASSYGPAYRETSIDTVFCKTHDGNAPNVKILRQNFFKADYLTVENIDFRNGWHAIDAYPANNSIFKNLYSRNFIGIAFFLAGGSSDNLVESCRADSGTYTPFYSWYAHRNIFRYDTAYVVQDTIMGIYSSIEQGGFGFERDTGSVVEYCLMEQCKSGGIDAFYDCQDTVRYCTIRNCGGGIWLNGDRWVCHNNTIEDITGDGTSISIQLVRYTTTWRTDGGGLTYGAGQTHVYDNILEVGSQGCGINLTRNVAQGTLLVEGNTIIGDHARTNLVLYERTGVTSINNRFIGLGRYSNESWISQHFYSTLAEFQDSTGLESGSKWYLDPTTSVQSESTQPTKTELEQNYPNPFNPSTVINFQLSVAGKVRLSVYDLLGREIAILVNGEKKAGNYSETFDGSILSNGVYFTRFIFNSGNGKQLVQTKKYYS